MVESYNSITSEAVQLGICINTYWHPPALLVAETRPKTWGGMEREGEGGRTLLSLPLCTIASLGMWSRERERERRN